MMSETVPAVSINMDLKAANKCCFSSVMEENMSSCTLFGRPEIE